MEQVSLEFQKTLGWVKNELSRGYTLSTSATNVDFSKGYFYSIFSHPVKLDYLYTFEYIEFEKKNKSLHSTSESFIDFLYAILKRKIESLCIFEDTVRYSTDKTEKPLVPFIKTYEKEMYYFIKDKEISKELIETAHRASEGLWHYLILCTKADVKEKTLSPEIFQRICDQANLLILGAYDGEGYVVWEKND